MNQLQKTLYEMLEEFDSICKQTGVIYYLAGGTALGAVRNHCFLPWDDDIDIYITRDNWKKLRKAIESNPTLIPGGRDFVYMENTEYYCNPIVRYVNKNTTSIMKSQILPAKACGQVIELLVMNPMPIDESKTDEYLKMLKVYTELVSPYFLVNKNASVEEYDAHLKLCKKYYKLFDKQGKEAVLENIRNEYLSFPEKDCTRFCMLWGIDTLIYQKADYGNGRLEKFENAEFCVGEYAENIFRVAYGDSWMYVPNKDSQVVHITMKDLNTPFERYTSQYVTKIDRDEYYKAFEREKRNVLEAFSYTRKLRALYAETHKIVAEMHINKSDAFDTEKIEELLISRKYDELNDIFSYYYSKQLDSDIRKNEMLIDVGDTILHYAIRNLIEQGRYYDAKKIMKLRLGTGSLTKELENDQCEIEFARNLSIARYDLKDIRTVESILSENEEKYSKSIEWLRGLLWVLSSKAKTTQEWENIKKIAEEAMLTYAFDGELISFLAQAYYELGDKKAGERLFYEAVHKTRNAFVWENAKNYAGIIRISEEINN